MCLNERGTDMRREQCFQELFVNSQMLNTTHCLHLMEKKVLVWSQTSQTRFSSGPDKRCCHGFDRKVDLPICIALVLQPCLGPLLPGTGDFSGILTANGCLSQSWYVSPTRTVLAAARCSSPLLLVPPTIRPKSPGSCTTDRSSHFLTILWKRYWTEQMSRFSVNQGHEKWEREKWKEWCPFRFFCYFSMKVPQAEFTPAEIRGLAACGCVCVCIYLYLFHLKFHNLGWMSTRVFRCVNVCLTVRVMCACKCRGREAGASLNKSTALFWTISFAKKDISSSISGTTCPPSLYCADNSIIPPPHTHTATTALPSLFCLPEIPLFLPLYPACLPIKLPNGSFSWWLNI